MSVRRLQVKLLNLLIILLPYHYLIFGVLFAELPGMKLWRDAVIILIWALEIIKNKKVYIDKWELIDILFGILTIVYIFFAPYLNQAFNMARVYLIPMLLFHSVRKMELQTHEITNILKKIYNNTIILCLYGIIQAYVLGSNFLIRLGYPVNSFGSLNDSYYLSGYGNVYFGRAIQRVVSTFSSANICGFYLCLVFIIFIYAKNLVGLSKRKYTFFIFFVGATLVLTFSRSTWLALAIALILVGRKQVFDFVKRQYKMIVLMIVIIVVIVIESDGVRSALTHIAISSVSGSDTSMVSHYATISNAFELIKDNPWGLGLGVNGPRALNYGNANLVESAILLIVFDFGILGAILYFMDYIVLIVDSFARKKRSIYSKLCLCTSIFVIIAYLNIPYVQEMECTCLAYVILAQTWKLKRG